MWRAQKQRAATSPSRRVADRQVDDERPVSVHTRAPTHASAMECGLPTTRDIDMWRSSRRGNRPRRIRRPPFF